jgi:DNA-binding transcriptional ArsR family regulator
MSAFVADLEVSLRGRLAELDDERKRIQTALSHLGPKPLVRKHKQHVPRGVNRKLILDALRGHGPLRVAELYERTGIARNTLSATLNVMKRAKLVTLAADGRWKART